MFLKNLPEIANVIKPYCMEQADNVESLHNLLLPADAPFTTFEGKGLFSHKILIQTPGSRYEQSNPEQQPLWHYDGAPAAPTSTGELKNASSPR
ncbi:ybl149 [Escherichia coli]|uniref:Ybl149 n=1 Tax=Escherichia coli TaxID=562 RepID=A0A377E0W3_ECOLX|nr:ybl149 [Escherichia coli]